MTEAEWLAIVEPGRMLFFLRERASDRKLRMFANACCRCVWGRLRAADSRLERIAETCERFVEGQASDGEVAAVQALAWAGLNETHDEPGWGGCWRLGFEMTQQSAWSAAATVAGTIREVVALRACTFRTQANLLRDIFGNPFRPVSLDTSWRAATVTSLAIVAYEERALPSGELDNARLAILADALEEAGCTDDDILSHLRSPGPHVRGCWALDLLLGKS